MIYVDFNGRCGDQFFQYAFARKIQIYLKNKEPLQFNFYNQQRWKNKIKDASFRNDLSHFYVFDNVSFVSEKQNLTRFGSKKQKKLYQKYLFIKRVCGRLKIKLLAKIWQKRLQKFGIYYDDEYFSFFKYPSKEENVFIRGYFEDFHIYEDETLRKALIKELSPKETSAFSNPIMKMIESSESVCVSIRSWKEVSQFKEVIDSRMVCDSDYFQKAITLIKEEHPNSEIFVFSDDINFAKIAVGKFDDLQFENKGNTIEDKIVLMSSCKHFILSNSSFSWWVQYLSKNQNGTVISPDRWYNDKTDNRLIKDGWIVI